MVIGGYYLFSTAIVLLLAPIDGADRPSRTAVVLTVVEASDADEAGAAFFVRLDHGATIALDQDPEVEPGEVVRVERPSYRPDGLTVDGVFLPSQGADGSTPDGSGLPSAFILVFLVLVPLGIVLGPMLWSIQSVRRIRRDLASGSTEQLDCRYLGSWMWRGLASSIEKRAEWFPVAAVPVAVATSPGTIRWFITPARTIERLVELEHALRHTSTAVTVRYHPATDVLASVASADGQHRVELEPALDTLSPDTGLPLVFSRRARRRRLPD